LNPLNDRSPRPEEGIQMTVILTEFGPVQGIHADLVAAAAEVLEHVSPAGLIELAAISRQRRPRVTDLVAALTLDWDEPLADAS
jgi:hypothetical protein